MENLEIFLPYQKIWMEDRSSLKIIQKGRRTGLTWTEAADAVLEAAASGGQSTYYLAYNKDMTKEFVEDCADWACVFGYAASGMQEIVLKDEDKDVTIYRIAFGSGHEIVGMPSEARNLRGKQGRVVFDEAAFCKGFDEVIKAALALLFWGGCVRVISTHNGEDNPFNILIKKIASGVEKKWSLHTVGFFDAVRQGLFKRICIKTGNEWSEESEKEFVEDIKDIYKDNIDEELNAIPSQSGQRYIGRALLDHNSTDDAVIRRLDCKDDFVFKSDEVKNREITRFFKEDVLPVLRSVDTKIYYGNDFGRSGDLTVYWIAHEAAKTALSTFLIIELKNCPFEQQQLLNDLITDSLKRRKLFGGGAIDSRGNGAQIGERAKLRSPGAVVQVMATQAWYAEFISMAKGVLESGEINVPNDETIKGDFSVIVLKNGIPAITPYKTDDRGGKGKRHGDGAIAFVHCVCAWKECRSDAEPVFIPSGRRREVLW